jgi:hypothetical protein
MMPWHPRPLLYEINTWVWLDYWSRLYKRSMTLDQVPPAEWDALAAWGFGAVWLMGVWERRWPGLGGRPCLWHDDFRQEIYERPGFGAWGVSHP